MQDPVEELLEIRHYQQVLFFVDLMPGGHTVHSKIKIKHRLFNAFIDTALSKKSTYT